MHNEKNSCMGSSPITHIFKIFFLRGIFFLNGRYLFFLFSIFVNSYYILGFFEFFNILVISIPIFGVFFLVYSSIRLVYLYFFCFYFCFVLIYFWYYFYFFFPFNMVFVFKLFSILNNGSCFFDNSFSFSLDVFSLLFIVLSSFLVLICSVVNWNLYYRLKEFYFLLIFCLILFVLVFCSSNLLVFYVLFELLLLPFYWFIGSWGSRDRKIVAAYQFFFFTFFGSLFILIAIIVLFSSNHSCEIVFLIGLDTVSIDFKIILLCCLLFGFIVKIPMFPVHLWLPEAHVEASTTGSILLAGILLKLGLYGIIRYLVPLFSDVFLSLWLFIVLIASLGVLYSCCITLYQVDLKKLVAYSSIAHMNLAVLGIFSYSYIGISGGICLLISHGWVSSALFFLVGCLYERYRTRVFLYYSGMASIMPLFSVFFFFFSLANMGFPGSSSFLAELLIFFGFSGCWMVQFVIMFSFILTTVYSIWLFERLCFGQIKFNFFRHYCDLTLREFGVILLFFLVTFIFGMFPKFFILMCDFIGFWVLNYI